MSAAGYNRRPSSPSSKPCRRNKGRLKCHNDFAFLLLAGAAVDTAAATATRGERRALIINEVFRSPKRA